MKTKKTTHFDDGPLSATRKRNRPSIKSDDLLAEIIEETRANANEIDRLWCSINDLSAIAMRLQKASVNLKGGTSEFSSIVARINALESKEQTPRWWHVKRWLTRRTRAA